MAVSCELMFLIISLCTAAGPRVQTSLREPVAKKGRQHQVQEFCMEGVEEVRESILGT